MIFENSQSVGRSTDSLAKSSATDYKKMMSNGSIESMDKSVLSSDTSYEPYDPTQRYNDYGLHQKKYSPTDPLPKTQVYGVPVPSTPSPKEPNDFELSYRNEGFRDNSTIYTNTTRNNSISTAINEDTPIIYQVDDNASDYYGNSSTLPMREKKENLEFLKELKHKLPEYENSRNYFGHSSFLPASMNRQHTPEPISNISQTSTLPYDQKVEKLAEPKPKTRRPNAFVAPPPEIRRPDSYMKALNPRDSIIPKAPSNGISRPKTVYESSEEARPRPVPSQSHIRSKSEALLETNFDESLPPPGQLTADNRSYSQPLETAM